MKIIDPILTPYVVDFDGVQYTLLENRVSKKDDQYIETHGYYTDLSFAIKKVCQLEISKKENLTLKEFMIEWNKLMERFKPLFYEN